MSPRALFPVVPGIASVMKQHAPAALIAAFLAAWSLPSAADSTRARCEIYPKGLDKLETMVPCTFGQRQGYITITREDGVSYELSPVGDAPGNFRDQDGNAVYRQTIHSSASPTAFEPTTLSRVSATTTPLSRR